MQTGVLFAPGELEAQEMAFDLTASPTPNAPQRRFILFQLCRCQVWLNLPNAQPPDKSCFVSSIAFFSFGLCAPFVFPLFYLFSFLCLLFYHLRCFFPSWLLSVHLLSLSIS
jgi:hypothetical protein